MTANLGRFAGALYVLTSIVGFFALGYVPGKIIVDGDAATTAHNMLSSEPLFRLGIVAELVGQTAFIFVARALYNLFEGVHRKRATLMVTLIVVSIPIVVVNELCSVAALLLVRGGGSLSAFDKPQREALAMLFLNLHDYGFSLAELFWGLWLFPLALLVFRSRFLPRFLGVWLALAGVAWIVVSLTGILAPDSQHAAYVYGQPAILGEIAFMLWLVIRGAKRPVLDVQP